MDQIQALKRISVLLKHSIKQRVQELFPAIPDNKLVEIQINAANSLEYEYQSPIIVKLFSQFKKDQVFEAYKTAQEVAKKVVEGFQNDGVIKKLEVQEQGFINISIDDVFIEQEINNILKFGLHFPLENKKKIVVDFSSPNIAKEMHVGHLRSTILGESTCRILEFQGHDVVRVNHIGDWGTQFGMLINHLFTNYPNYKEERPKLTELEEFYIQAKALFDKDPEFKKNSQQYVVKLQAYDPDCIDAWKLICDLSRQEYNKIYQRLNIKNTEYGESFYNDMIPGVIKHCEDIGIVEVDKGAKIIRIKNEKVPVIILKSDGGYNYDSTDMAAAKLRLVDWKADRVLYLTDVGQFPHFKLIFEAAKMAGWYDTQKQSLEHMGFGLVLGPDGKKFKTREGNAVKLMELLNEAKTRALDQIKKRATDKQEGKEHTTGTQLTEEEYDVAAEKMGIAAVKYFDLKQNRISDYRFIYDHMLDPKGNTAVYLMYSYVRVLSVLRKAEVDINLYHKEPSFKITHPHERHLAALILRLPDVLQSVTDQLAINWLCDYLYEICVKVAEAYQKYRVIDQEHKQTRIQLFEAVRIILDKAFFLVGMETVEKI